MQNKPKHNEVTKNILKLIDLLKGLQIIRFDTEFCQPLDMFTQTLNNIRTGERNFPKTKIANLIQVFHVNPAYIASGEMPVFATGGDYENYNEVIYGNPYLRDMLTKDWTNLSEIQIPAFHAPLDKNELIKSQEAEIKELKRTLEQLNKVVENQQKLIGYMEREIASYAIK